MSDTTGQNLVLQPYQLVVTELGKDYTYTAKRYVEHGDTVEVGTLTLSNGQTKQVRLTGNRRQRRAQMAAHRKEIN